MLKKQNRLARVSKSRNAKTLSSSLFTIRVFDNEEVDSKFGFVVSKKISKSAVLRNRTKRVIKKIVEENIKKISSSKNIIIITKKSFSWDKKQVAEKDLMSILNKIK